MLTTALCTVLGMERPIPNAPMAGTAAGELAATVSEAGVTRVK
jgi:NAD(P)H-dependent flavin oxidoreductase YrpB (nitropropane dioxygenase family)